jgi:hypothetical protein
MDLVIANLAIEEIAQAVDFRHGHNFGEAAEVFSSDVASCE